MLILSARCQRTVVLTLLAVGCATRVGVASAPTSAPAPTTAPAALPLYASDFAAVGYGNAPPGWRDLIDIRPSRNWAIDGKGFLRPMLKQYTGLIVYDGALASGEQAG